MGKLDIFTITLSNPQAVYYGGQIIDGYVTVELNQPMKMRGIRLNFQGWSEVHWSEEDSSGTGDDKRTVTEYFSANESYFNHIIVLYGKAPGQSGDNPTLGAGRYTYPFQFQLPEGIPSSYESITGKVRYSLTGVIDKPWRFDHTIRQELTVLSQLDLNQEPSAMQSATETGTKHLCCLCCTSGPISAVLTLNRLGYVPGEAISICGEVLNYSNRTMASSFAQIVMRVDYHATTKTQTLNSVVAKTMRGEIPPGEDDTWNGQTLIVPPLPPSGLRGCKIIDITYILSLNVVPTGLAYDLVVPINILIGTIPLQSTVSQYGFPSPLATSGNVYGSTSQPESLPVQPSAPVPPPSYAECVIGKVDIHEEGDNEHTRGNRNMRQDHLIIPGTNMTTTPSSLSPNPRLNV